MNEISRICLVTARMKYPRQEYASGVCLNTHVPLHLISRGRGRRHHTNDFVHVPLLAISYSLFLSSGTLTPSQGKYSLRRAVSRYQRRLRRPATTSETMGEGEKVGCQAHPGLRICLTDTSRDKSLRFRYLNRLLLLPSARLKVWLRMALSFLGTFWKSRIVSCG